MITNIKKLLTILSYKNKIKLFFVLLCQIVNSLLDVLAVISIYPFLAFLSNSPGLKNNIIFIFFQNKLNLSDKNIIIVFGLLSVFIILCNQVFRVFSTWFTLKVNLQIWLDLHNSMYKYYLEQPYSFHLNNNSTSLLEKLQVRVNAAAVGVIMPPIYLISHTLTTFAVLTIMLLANFIATIVTFTIFSLFYFLVYKNIKSKMAYYGSVHPVYSNAAFNLISDSFKSIAEIKLMKNEKFFVNLFSPIADKYCDAGLKKHLYTEAPTSFIEILAYMILIVICLIFLGLSDDFLTNLPLIGIFIFALRKILPALQMIYKLFTDIAFNKPSFEIIYEDLKNAYNKDRVQKNITNKITISKFNEIKFKNINFAFNKNNKVLTNINFFLKKGSKVGIVGGSGSGKTTLLNILMGLLSPNSGEMKIDDKNFNDIDINSFQNKIGYVSQNGYISDKSIIENVAFGQTKESIDEKKIIEVLKVAQLYDFILNELDGNLESSVGENGIKLSGGQRQRLRIARMLYYNPEIIILDEATNALDLITETNLVKSINQKYEDKTIIAIAHRVNTLKDYDNIYIMNNGRILDQGKYEKLYNNNDFFKQLVT